MIRTKINYLLIMLVFLASGQAIAQPEITVETDTIFVALDTLESGEISTHWDVANNQFGTMQLMCSRNFIDVVGPYNYPYVGGAEGSYEKFCWGPICYNYGTDASNSNSGFLVNIPQNGVDTTFIPYFYPNGVTGTSTIEYCFHPVGNQSVGTCATITYVVSATADVKPNLFEGASISTAYPNPVTTESYISYSIPSGNLGEIITRDLTGKIVQLHTSLRSEGRVTLNADDLSEGLYFTTLEIEGIVISTKRFVVAK